MTTQAHARRVVRWAPESRLGRWAVAAAACCLGAVALLVLGFATGVVEMADSYGDSWGQALWGLLIWASALAALAIGLVAALRAHDHARLVRVAIVIGLLPPALLASEIALGKF